MRTVLILPALLAALMTALPAGAQNVLVRNATVHTMGPDGVLEDTDVLVRGGRIERIGRDLPVPAGDFPVFDAEGRPVTPGLFAGVTSLGLEEISLEAQTVDRVFGQQPAIGLGEMRPEFDVTPAYNPNSTLVPVTRIEGYAWALLGAVRGDSIIGGQGRAVVLDGGFDSFAGPSVLFVDVGGDASLQAGGSRAAQWMLLEQALTEQDGDDDALLTRRGRQALAGFKGGQGHVVFQVDRAADILQALAFAKKHGLNAIIGGGAEAWMVADRLAEAGVPVLLDPLLNLPTNFDTLGARLDNAALLHAAGVSIAFAQTPDMESHNARKMRQLAGNAVAHGLPHEAGLAGLTLAPARIFGLAENFGSIETGKRGDLVIWSLDPLEVTSVAERVIIGGKVMPMESRQTLLRDRYLAEDPELPRQYLKP